MSFSINVDPTNPGQFFACCGLLELADRLWPGAEGWFENGKFLIESKEPLAVIIETLARSELVALDPGDFTSTPIEVALPSRPLRLDWWHDKASGGSDLKVWAGSMESLRIAKAMQRALSDALFQDSNLFNVGVITYDVEDPTKKVEPFYFDARRTANAHSRDVGFSTNDFQMTSTAYPAVELLCLVGLQRCLPLKTERPRVFEYLTWSIPVPPILVPAVGTGSMRVSGTTRFRFENWFRTAQRKHKAFRSAVPLTL